MRTLFPILTLTFLLYLAVTYLSSPLSNFDAKSYSIIGSLTLEGESIYPDPALSRHPYLPLFLYFEAATQTVSSLVGIPQIVLIKIILSIVHLLSVYAVYILSKKSRLSAFLYALNPVSLAIIAFHGQFDIIPLTCILFALISLQQKHHIKTIILLSLAITIKTWPLLFVFPFLKRIQKKVWPFLIIIPLICLLLYSFLFHTSVISIARVLLVYQGVGNVWGVGWLLSFISPQKMFLLFYKFIFVLGILFYSYKQEKKPIIGELFQLLILFFIFTPGFGIQWFIWLMPFLFLSPHVRVRLIVIPLTLCMCIVYLSWFPFFSISNTAISLIFFLTWILFIGYSFVWRFKEESFI